MAEAQVPEPQTPTEPVPTDPSPTPAATTDPTTDQPNGEATIADGGGSPDEAQPGPATWPDDWRQQFAGDDTKALKTLGRYKDPNGLWKAHQALRAKMDSGELAPTRPDTKDEEELKAWRAEAGVPENVDGYMEKLPETMEISDEDKPHVERFFSEMLKGEVPADQAMIGLNAYYSIMEDQATAQAEDDHKNRQATDDELRSGWGAEYRVNLNTMHAMLDTYAPEGVRDAIFTARTSDGTPLGDHSGFLNLMVGLAREINPVDTVVPTGGQTPMASIDGRIAELNTEMADTKAKAGPDSYWNNEGKQQEYRKLLEAKERMEARGS